MAQTIPDYNLTLNFAVNGRELTVYLKDTPHDSDIQNCTVCGGTGEEKEEMVLLYTYEVSEMVENGVQLSLADGFFEAVKAEIDAVGCFDKAYCSDCYAKQLNHLHRELGSR